MKITIEIKGNQTIITGALKQIAKKSYLNKNPEFHYVNDKLKNLKKHTNERLE